MAPEIVAQLGSRGLTQGKTDGCAWVFLTRSLRRKMGGSLRIESQVGMGTRVEMAFHVHPQINEANQRVDAINI